MGAGDDVVHSCTLLSVCWLKWEVYERPDTTLSGKRHRNFRVSMFVPTWAGFEPSILQPASKSEPLRTCCWESPGQLGSV